MNTLDTLFSRRSIRSYTGEGLSEAELSTIIKAAYASPVGRAMFDTLALTVVTDKNFIAEWDSFAATAFGKADFHPLYNAPVVIIVSSAAVNGEIGNVQYSNAAILVQNMAIAATELGLGSCHIWGAIRALVTSDELLAKLSIPAGMTPCCAIILGKTEEKYALRDIPEEKIKTNFVK